MRFHRLAVLSCLAGCPLAAAAGDALFVAGPTGDVWKGDPLTGEFAYFGCTCNGPLQSMAIGKEEVFAGDSFGSIVSFDLETGALRGFSFVPSPTTALVVFGEELLVSEHGGEIHRVGMQTGVADSGMTAPIQVDAMLEHDGFLYVAGPSGDVWRAPLGGGGFSYFACACIPSVTAMAVGDGELVVASVGGLVLRFDFATGFINGGFQVEFEPTAMVAQAGDLLISDAGGLVRRVDALTGDVLGSFQTPREVETMALLVGPVDALGDLDGDGVVSSSDLASMLGAWGPCGGACAADLNGDGAVNAADLAALLGAWNG